MAVQYIAGRVQGAGLFHVNTKISEMANDGLAVIMKTLLIPGPSELNALNGDMVIDVLGDAYLVIAIGTDTITVQYYASFKGSLGYINMTVKDGELYYARDEDYTDVDFSLDDGYLTMEVDE